jgi:hypothetical protein
MSEVSIQNLRNVRRAKALKKSGIEADDGNQGDKQAKKKLSCGSVDRNPLCFPWTFSTLLD